MAEYIRVAEEIIDNYHKHSPVFSLNRKTALFNALTVFEDACRLGGTTNIALIGDSLEYSFLIREQLDSLSILIQWIFQDCSHNEDDAIDMRIVSETYVATADLLQFHAKLYSPICMGQDKRFYSCMRIKMAC